MSDSTVSLRPARPTTAEGLRFAHYLDTAAGGIFRFMLGSGSDRVLAEAYRSPGHDLSFERVTFAEVGGEIVGMASSHSSQQHEQSSESPILRAAGWRTVRMVAVSIALFRLFRFIDALDDGDSYLLALAVDAEQRGLGIGSTLFRHTEERARDAGSGRLTLVVAVDNENAQRLYERMGMTIVASSPRPMILPDGQVHRMAKPL